MWSAPGPGARGLRDGRDEPTRVPRAGATSGLYLPVRPERSLSAGAGGRGPRGGGGGRFSFGGPEDGRGRTRAGTPGSAPAARP